mmetsp:Transcript_6362/g.10041  ORF Transcript_6362/g.10041 Transcript_6362/m.10041 type:complete len:284 (-) Transcript_6362:1738-2589(-)
MAAGVQSPVRQILTASEAWKVLGERRKVRVETTHQRSEPSEAASNPEVTIKRPESDPLSSWMKSSTAWKMLGARHLERRRSSGGASNTETRAGSSEPVTPVSRARAEVAESEIGRTASAPAAPAMPLNAPKSRGQTAGLYLMQELQKLASKQHQSKALAGKETESVDAAPEQGEPKMDSIREESAVCSSVEGSSRNLGNLTHEGNSTEGSVRALTESSESSPLSGSPGCSGIAARRGRSYRRRRSSTTCRRIISDPIDLVPANDPRMGLLYTDAAHLVLADVH